MNKKINYCSQKKIIQKKDKKQNKCKQLQEQLMKFKMINNLMKII